MTSIGLRTCIALVVLAIAMTACTSKYDRAPNNELTANENTLARHFYAAVGLGAGQLRPDASQSNTRTLDDRVEAAGQVAFGVDVNRHLSVEVHSADLGSAGFSPAGRINYHFHGGSFLFYTGKNRDNYKRNGLSAYARLGYGYLDNSKTGDVNFVQDNATSALVGGGVEYMTRIGLGFRIEAIAYQEDAQFAQLGVIYRAGRPPRVAPAPPTLAAAQVIVVSEPVPVYDPCANLDAAFEQVNFHTASSHLTTTATQVLQGVAIALATCEERPVTIRAHTDSVGSHAYNRGLSSRRAKSVMRYLYSSGVAIERMKARGFGETTPIDTNQSYEGRRKNRRVEMILN